MQFPDLISSSIYLKLNELRYLKYRKPYKTILQENIKYKNIHKGERCFILGNGPSINNMDFALLNKEITFTVNQLARNPKFEELETNYHMWADAIFFEIEESNKEDMEMLKVIKAVSRQFPDAVIFYEVTAKSMIEKYHLQEHSNIAFFQTLGMNTHIVERGYIDFTHIIPRYPTVIDYAICMAVYMGIVEIYLLGCDCTGFINIAQNKMNKAKDNLYAFEISDNAAKRMERYASRRSIKNELNSYAELFKKYEELNVYCERHGVKLFNATNGGLLENIQRVKLEDVL